MKTPAKLSVLLLTVASVSILSAACNRVDCFDDAELEASYQSGESSAAITNQREFERGQLLGLSLNEADGRSDGSNEGFAAGYDTGYLGPNGYDLGYNWGYDEGHDSGLVDPSACADGVAAADVDGYDAGDRDGYDTGYGESFDLGYDDGYFDGTLTCNVAGTRMVAGQRGANQGADEGANQGELKTCFDRGYRKQLDPNSYASGLAAGKRENPLYQRGYLATYEPAFADGRSQGETIGYSDGYDDGYVGGYDDGADLAFDSCYSVAYPSAYSDGYETGYPDGYASGYEDGYASGYDSSYCE